MNIMPTKFDEEDCERSDRLEARSLLKLVITHIAYEANRPRSRSTKDQMRKHERRAEEAGEEK